MSAQPQASRACTPRDPVSARARRPVSAADRPLRVLPIPDTDPPPVSSLPPRHPLLGLDPGSPADYVQGTLAVDFQPESADDPFFAPQATSTQDLPDAADWSASMIRAILEGMDGTRPTDQLSRWLAPPVHERVTRRGKLSRQQRVRQRHAPLIRRVLVCYPTDGVAEVAAVVQHRGRVRAMALRLAGSDGRWVVCALELG